MHWDENFRRVVGIGNEVRDGRSDCWIIAIKGSTHLSQTDFAILHPSLMSWFMKTMVNPWRATQLTIHSSLEYFKRVLPETQTAGTYWVDQGVLDSDVLLEGGLANKHRPEDKWITARLKIPNEFWLQVASCFRRATNDLPKDVNGKQLVGVVTCAPGEEVWTHMKVQTVPTGLSA